MNSAVVNAPPRTARWKRRLKIRDSLTLIAALAVDLSLLRAANRFWLLPLVPLVGLLALLVIGFFVWRYVPRSWDRPCYVGALMLYLVFLAALVVSYNPVLVDPLLRFWGVN